MGFAGLFFIYFRSFQSNITIATVTWKMTFQYPLQGLELDYESPP